MSTDRGKSRKSFMLFCFVSVFGRMQRSFWLSLFDILPFFVLTFLPFCLSFPESIAKGSSGKSLEH